MDMQICHRCEGCGHIVATSRFEMPWVKWAKSQKEFDANPVARIFRPRVCPSCDGAGTLPEQPNRTERQHSYMAVAELC